MANKFTITNSGTVWNKLRFLIGTAAVVGVVWGGVKMLDSAVSYHRYNSRISSVEKMLEKKDFEQASAVLEGYSQANVLEEGDIIPLRAKLEQSKEEQKQFEERQALLTRQQLEEGKKEEENKKSLEKQAAQIKNLESLISEGKHDEAQSLLFILVKQGITEDNAKSYSEKINAISLETLLNNIEKSDGEEQMGLIDKFVSAYPANQKVPELRKKQIDRYFLIADSYFKAGIDEVKVSDFLKKFNSWLAKQDSSLLSGEDFLVLYKSGRDYVDRLSNKQVNTIQRGDRVIIKRSLGSLIGLKDENYFFDSNTNIVKLGTEAVVQEIDSKGTGSYGLFIPNFDRVFYVIAKEIDPVNKKVNASIYQQLEILKKYADDRGQQNLQKAK